MARMRGNSCRSRGSRSTIPGTPAAVRRSDRLARARARGLRGDRIAAVPRERPEVDDRLLELGVRVRLLRIGQRRIANLQILALDLALEPAGLVGGILQRFIG